MTLTEIGWMDGLARLMDGCQQMLGATKAGILFTVILRMSVVTRSLNYRVAKTLKGKRFYFTVCEFWTELSVPTVTFISRSLTTELKILNYTKFTIVASSKF